MEILNTAQNIKEAADYIRSKAEVPSGSIGVICGSGLGNIAEAVQDAVRVSYLDVPSMPISTAPEHRGEFVIGTLAGKPVVCMHGRLHCYEGYTAQQIAFPIYVMHELGAERILTTNAAGGIDASYNVGDIMLIEDHINFMGVNPIAGPLNPEVYPRYFDMTNAYDPEMRELAAEQADKLGIKIHKGVYIGIPGPSFETPAEIRAFRALGADAVGMSTVLEVIAARSCGMKVLGFSMISNPAAGVCDEPLDMKDVFNAAKICAVNIEELLEKVIEQL